MLNTGSVINLYLKPKKSSQINALIGFLPSSDPLTGNKLLVTGEATINLKNALGNGEIIGLNWQQLQAGSPRLNLLFQRPYLFNSPFGLITSFDLYKKDSSYMKKIINNNYPLKNKLKGGVDVLICPHHGLKSSFSTFMFDCMKNGKTNSLNIVSEKINNPDESRTVDLRYSSSDFCNGNNNLEGGNGIKECYQVKTSRGHIFIDYSTRNHPTFEIITDNKILIDRFEK